MRDQSEAHRLLASSYAHLADEEARHHAEQVMRIHPNFRSSTGARCRPTKIPENAIFIDGLRKAGLRYDRDGASTKSGAPSAPLRGGLELGRASTPPAELAAAHPIDRRRPLTHSRSCSSTQGRERVMGEPRQPDETRAVAIAGGYKVVTYSFGSGDEVVLCLNGGPGLPCDYLREPHACLADHGYRVVAYDQLGCGASDKPDDSSLWTIERYAKEVETVREALGLGRSICSASPGAAGSSIEYGVTWPQHLKTIILENTCGDMPHLVSELNRLRAALGPETEAMMQQHEAEGTARPSRIPGRDHHPEPPPRLPPGSGRHRCSARSRAGTWRSTAPCRGRTSSSTPAI